MAARRLLIVMLVLLGISTLAAALVPPPEDREGDESTATTASTPTETQPAAVEAPPEGAQLSAQIVVGGKQIPVVPIELGDQLELTMCSQRTDLLEIPLLGLFDAVSPISPARVDVLPTEEGSYGVNFVRSGKLAARIRVDPPTKEAPAEPDRAEKSAPCEGAAQ